MKRFPRNWSRGLCGAVLLGAALGMTPALAQTPAEPAAPAAASAFRVRPVDDTWRAALPRDASAATQAYLDRLPADERCGARWRLHGVADVASLPLLAAVLSGYLFVATPLLNTITRTQEVEADLWGLNPGARTARRSRGAAETGGVPQGRPGADRRVRLLHPPQHAPAHLQRDALARADAGAAVKASGLEDSTPWPGALSTSSRDLH